MPPRMAGHLDPKPIETSDVTDFFTASHGLWGKYFSEFAGKVLRRGRILSVPKHMNIIQMYIYICIHMSYMRKFLSHEILVGS